MEKLCHPRYLAVHGSVRPVVHRHVSGQFVDSGQFYRLVAVTMISVTLTAAIIFVVGLNHGERSLITEKIVRRHQR